MRRPSPLPQQPSPSAQRPAGTPAAKRASAATPREETTDASPGGVLVEPDENATTPIAPLSAPAPLPPAAHDDPGDADSADVAGNSARVRDVGLREVWKAARARRKALRAEIRRFTVRQRRRRAMWIGAAASLLLLAVATIGAAYSPLFGVEKITVVGAQQLDAAELSAALSDQLGTPLPLVDESAVKAALVPFPLIETYALEARPPHELVVRIVERTPIGVIETRAGYTLVDAAGVALSTSAAPSVGMPVLDVSGGVHSDAFAAAGQVMRSLPNEIRVQVTTVTASTPDDVTLTLGGTNTQVVWGSAEKSAAKALNLSKMMLQRPPAGVSVYDVTSAEVVVVR